MTSTIIRLAAQAKTTLVSRPLSGKRALIAVGLATAAVSAVVETSIANHGKTPRLTERSAFALANRCFALRSQ